MSAQLRHLIEAMGGELDVVARFPGKPPIRIVQFAAIMAEDMPIETRGDEIRVGPSLRSSNKTIPSR